MMRVICKKLVFIFVLLGTVSLHVQAKVITADQALTCDANASVNSTNSCPYPFDVESTDPIFKNSLSTSMERAGLGELWNGDGILRGPATPLIPVSIAGVTWLGSTSCEAHNCSNHFINYLYQPALKGFVALYHHDDNNYLIGNPDVTQIALLKKM